MLNQEKIKSLLGSGLSPAIVANTVGCDPSYISQLMAEEGFAQAVVEMRTKDLVKYKELDSKYDELEAKLLKKLEDITPLMMKPRDILSALQLVNNAKRKSAGIPTDNNATDVVRLQLPTKVINNISVNMNGNVIRVDGRDLTPMPSSALMQTLEDKMKGKVHDLPLSQEQEAATHQPGELLAKSIPSERIINAQQI